MIPTFMEWLREMCGTGAIYDGSKHPDFQWWGAPQTAGPPRPKKVRKKRRKGR